MTDGEDAADNVFHPAFLAGLRSLATVFDSYHTATGRRPVLVGGAAVSIFTGGLVASGDFDVIAPREDAWDRAVAAQGWRREDRHGYLRFGWYHPDIPEIGVQLVAGPLFEGRTDELRLTLISVKGAGTVQLAPIEDMIADRLGQYASTPSPVYHDMLEQAVVLFQLATEIDRDYLLRRIVEEGGDPAQLGLGNA